LRAVLRQPGISPSSPVDEKLISRIPGGASQPHCGITGLESGAPDSRISRHDFGCPHGFDLGGPLVNQPLQRRLDDQSLSKPGL